MASNTITDALILAAGFGTRLAPLTNNVPKALVRVNGVPLLDYAIEHLAVLTLQNIYINAHYLAESITQHVNALQWYCDVKLRAIFEPKILNTGGAIKNIFITYGIDNLLVHNADSIFYDAEFIQDFMSGYSDAYDSYLCLYPKAAYAFVEKGDCNIVDNTLQFSVGGKYIYTGLAIHNRRQFVRQLSDDFSLLDILKQPNINLGYYIMPQAAHWLDVGTMERLQYANNIIKNEHRIRINKTAS